MKIIWGLLIAVAVSTIATYFFGMLMIWAILVWQVDGIFWYGLLTTFFGVLLKVLLKLETRAHWF